MAEPRSGPLSSPLAQFGLGAVVLIAVAALLFALIGAVTDGDPVASGPAVDDTPTGTATTATTEAPTTSGTEPTTEPGTEAPPTTEEPTTTPPADPEIDPATISVQILDGVGNSEQQFDAVTACLQEAGYGPLITNDAAVAYETTEVFYTAGDDNDAAARQVAAAIGVSDVEEKPDSLSDSVPVHVVVGRDATAPC